MIGQFEPSPIFRLTKSQIINATLLDEVQFIEEDYVIPVDDDPTVVLGDADKDSALTVLDATHIQRYLVGLVGEAEIDLTAADFDGDGGVTILDATAIQRHLAELTT